MFKMIRQFTFHKPREIFQPTLWLFLSQACSMIPAVLAYMAIYTVGQAFVPPYTLELPRLAGLAAVSLGYVLLQYIVEIISYYFTYGRAYRDTADKRIAYIQKLRRQPLGFFSSKESGELISSFAGDFANVEYTLCYWLPYPMGVGLLLLISVVWICAYDVRMGISMFTLLPVCALLMLLVSRIKERHSRRVMEAKTKAATQLNEYLRGMKDLKAYQRTGGGFESMEAAMRHLRDESLKEEGVAGSLSTLCASLVKFIVPVTAASGIYLLINEQMNVLDFAGFLILATKLTEPVLMIVTSISALRGMVPSAERLDQVMTSPGPLGEEKIVQADSYTFDDVSFGYEEGKDVVQNISFETASGSLTALVGPSGSGKSTLLRLMARFWDCQEGHIRMNGTDIKEVWPDSLLAHISMVMQNTYLFRGSIRENLCFGDESVTEERMIEACKKARCHSFISGLPERYETIVGEGGATLSGGERQRISLARAFLKDVPILLLDEPTASLDADNEAMVQKALDEISRERTVVMIAHRLKTVRAAEQIVVLRDGKIVQKGTHSLLARQEGLYARLWKLQNQAESYTFKQS